VAGHTLTERDAPAPTDAYGRSKLAAEAAVRASGVPFTILRPVALYGPDVRGNFAFLLRAALSRWPLPVKNFLNRRSLLGMTRLAVSQRSFTCWRRKGPAPRRIALGRSSHAAFRAASA